MTGRRRMGAIAASAIQLSTSMSPYRATTITAMEAARFDSGRNVRDESRIKSIKGWSKAYLEATNDLTSATAESPVRGAMAMSHTTNEAE